MCSACGIPTHVLELDPAAPAAEIGAPAPAKFAALRNADCRPYQTTRHKCRAFHAAYWVIFAFAAMGALTAAIAFPWHATRKTGPAPRRGVGSVPANG